MGFLDKLFNRTDINIAVEQFQATPGARDINAPLYVYCQSGARSGQAVSMIREMGYKNVTNIGGVNRYKGKLVR